MAPHTEGSAKSLKYRWLHHELANDMMCLRNQWFGDIVTVHKC